MRSDEWAARMETRARGLDTREEFEYMLEQAKVNGWEDRMPCHRRPKDFTDFRSPVSQERAAALCKGCPLLALHREVTEYFPPVWGVEGGISWVDGKPFEPVVKLAA